MTRLLLLCSLTLLGAGAFARPQPDPLPGEPATKPALAPDPFPDRLSAYVWRNWMLVPHDRLARVIGASESELEQVAVEMGLPAKVAVLPEWERKGYITVLRRNWHLLPYGQLTALLNKTREELAFNLVHDDFLFVKLGNLKPKCDRLVWDAAAARATANARRRLASVLASEGVNPAAPEEPRFAFVREMAAPASTPAATLPAAANSPFDFRLIFSYFADYCDPLGDPEIGSYPEGLLQRLAAQGVNAVWLHTVLHTLATDPKYPEFGAGSENRMANLRTLVARAAKYGIRIYLYMNEPRAFPAAFFEKDGRQAIRGAPGRDGYCICTSTVEGRRLLADALEQVFRNAPGLGGIFTITASENTTTCASHAGQKEKCPRCKNRTRGEIIAEVNRVMVEGMTRGNPAAEALVYSWQWPGPEEEAIVNALPKHNCRVMTVSENKMPFTIAGVSGEECDYSISLVGPGESALALWAKARKAGIPCVAKVQVNNSWELSPFPYLPVFDLNAEQALNLANAGVGGVMLSWSCGCAPAPNLRVYRDLEKGAKTADGVLDRIATDLYGAKAAPFARAAWHRFAQGFREYPFHITTLYSGPQHWGPANPLYARPTGYAASMVGIPYDAYRQWCAIYPPDVWAAQMEKVAAGFASGCLAYEAVLAAVPPEGKDAVRKEMAMFRGETLHFASSAAQVRFYLAREAGDTTEMKRQAARELAHAKELLGLARADSRFGYECSNHYFYTPLDICEKILSCRAVIDER